MPPSTLDPETRYRILQLLERSPDISQRELAEHLGFSLGKVNYCLNALIDRGLVKVVNFRRSNNKAAYLYKLTPDGIAEKLKAARRFLQRRIQEHRDLEQEIATLRRELHDQHDVNTTDQVGSME